MTPPELLHQAYCEAMGIELPINSAFARYWHEADKEGLDPDGLKLAIKARIKRNFSMEPRYQIPLSIRKLVGDEERIADVINEAAVIRAEQRKKQFVPAKAEVLRVTGRPDEPEQSKTRHIGEIIKLREAANQ